MESHEREAKRWLQGLLLLVMSVSLSTAGPVPSYEERLEQALMLMQQGHAEQAAQTIGELDGAGAVNPTLGRLWFLRATLAQKLQDPDTALNAFAQVWRTYPPLADYAGWEMAQYYAAQELLPALQHTVGSLITRYPFSRLAPEAQLLLARTQQRLGYASQARATLEHFLQSFPDHSGQPEALALLGKMYEESGNLVLAAQTLQRLGELHPRQARAATALDQGRKLLARLPEAQRPRPDPAALLASLDRLAEGQHWQEVEARLQVLAEVTQPATLAVHILLKRATLEIRRKQWLEATVTLQTLWQRHPTGGHLAEASFLLASVAQGQEQPTTLKQYERVFTQYADTPWAAKALLAAARLQEEREDATPAATLYLRLAYDFPTHEQAPQSLWKAGWLHYRQRRYDVAERLWSEFETRFPRHVLLTQVLYWQSRAAHQGGRPEVALQLCQRLSQDYTTYYYSEPAYMQLQAAGRPVPSPTVQTSSTAFWEPAHPPRRLEASAGRPTQERFHFLRAQELHRLQMYAQAIQEIRALAPLLPDTPAAQYFLAAMYIDNQQYPPAFRLLHSVIETLSPEEVRGLPRTFWTMLYPQLFWPEVTQQAQQTALNPYLVLSIIRQESAFNPAAVSSSGARGLMQLLPSTAQEVATRLKMPEATPAQLQDPPFNITLGTRYFADLLKRYQGNMVFALAGYNAGPGRVAQWRKQWPDLPMDEFIERIPLEETRAYVKLVLRNRMLYERLYKTL